MQLPLRSNSRNTFFITVSLNDDETGFREASFLFDAEQKKNKILDYQAAYWKRMAEGAELDLKIKKKKLEDQAASVELKKATVRHLQLKDNILRNRFLRESEGDPLAIGPNHPSSDLNKSL